MTSKPRILIGLTTMGSIHTFLAVRVMAWISQAWQHKRYDLSVYPTICVSPVDQARNEVVTEFLKSDCTHLLFIDSDTIPPQDTIDKMLEHDKAVVTALTPIIDHEAKKQNNGANGFYKKWNAVDMNDKFTMPNIGLIPIKGCGSSCILIKRSVFEKVPKPWYRFLYSDDTGKEIFMGEDTHFIAKCIGVGIKSYADTSIICGHSKPIVW